MIDSFTTIGFNVNIQEFNRRGSECPTEASIQLKVDIRGVLPSAVKFGIVWQHDIFSDPTLDDNVILADQITADGTATILLPVLCDKLYRVRSFIHLSDNEVLYDQAVEFTSEPGGVWEYVGEITEQFTRSQGFRSFSLDQQGYVIGIRKELFQEVQKSELPQEIEPEVGMGLMAQNPDGSQRQLRVAEVHDEHIVIDANHPLAGHNLVFDLEVVEIKG